MERNFWMCGLYKKNNKNLYLECLDNGIWLGDPSGNEVNWANNVRPNDIIVVKRGRFIDALHNSKKLFNVEVLIAGIVTSIVENNNNHFVFKVSYCKIVPKTFVEAGMNQYSGTIYPLKHETIKNYIIEQIQRITGFDFKQDKIMEDNMVSVINGYVKRLAHSRNLILTGAPGTGKTYLARKIAEAMNQGVELSDEDRKNTVGFVQFHPSYDYVDFVEGLRPDRSGDNVVFKREDGIFKKFCKRAIEKSKSTGTDGADNFDAAWNRMMDEAFKQNEILTIERPQSIMYLRPYYKSNNKEYRRKGFCNGQLDENGDWIPYDGQFFNKTQCYDLYRKVPQKYKSNGGNHYRRAIIDYMKEHCGLEDYQPGDTSHSQTINYVFIIDEINRGDLSKIFGELFFAIDPGYRGEEGRVKTQYQQLVDAEDDDEFSGEGFYVPDNVYIIGTMNDIDRSVESMDFALRRRFAWQKIKPEDTANVMGITGDARERMDAMNKVIKGIPELGEDYQIGGAYFLKMVKENLTAEELWQFHLESLIDEYLRGLPNKDELYKKIKNAYDNPRKTNDETKPQENSADD